MKRLLILVFVSFFTSVADAQGILAALAMAEDSAGWKKHTISPVADMMEFEDPVVRTEIRPVFMYQNIANNYVTGGGYAMLAGAQVRLALTNRFAIMVTKGGYLETHPAVGQHSGGWADLTFGFKYVLVDDMESNFILTGGMTATTPNGDRKILHGRGSGFLNPFLSFEKGWGDFHLMGTLVYNQALHRDSNSSHLHYGLNADYHACDWFIPFVSAVAWTVTDAGSAVPLNLEGYDAVNFGSSGSYGRTQVVLGWGFRTRFNQHFDIGLAYQKSVATPRGLFDDRITVDCVLRF